MFLVFLTNSPKPEDAYFTKKKTARALREHISPPKANSPLLYISKSIFKIWLCIAEAATSPHNKCAVISAENLCAYILFYFIIYLFIAVLGTFLGISLWVLGL